MFHSGFFIDPNKPDERTEPRRTTRARPPMPPPDEAPPGEETPEEHKARILDQPVWPSYQPEE